MDDAPKHDPLQAMKDRPTNTGLWYTAAVVIVAVVALNLGAFTNNGAHNASIAVLMLPFALFAVIIVQHFVSETHVRAKGDRLVIRQFLRAHTITYKDLVRITFIPAKTPKLHLETQTEAFTTSGYLGREQINSPFIVLMEELGEIIGWQTSALTKQDAFVGQDVAPIVMFDAEQGDRITTDAVIAPKVHRHAYVATAYGMLAIFLLLLLPLAFIVGLGLAGEEAFSVLHPVLGISFFLFLLPLMALLLSPRNRYLIGYGVILSALATALLVLGHSREGLGIFGLIANGLTCFAVGIGVVMLLRFLGTHIARRDAALSAQLDAAIEAVIASGAVKDRRDQWDPQT